MVPLAFHGGTCLRFLFALPRYSEDLDFTLEGDPSRYDLRAWLKAIRAELAREGYVVDLSMRDGRTVHSAFVRVRGILHEAGLSLRREEALAVKIEVDTRPPAGAVLDTPPRAPPRHLAPLPSRPGVAARRQAPRRPAAVLHQGAGPVRLDLVPERSDVAGTEPDPAERGAAADRLGRRGAERPNLAGNRGRPNRRPQLGPRPSPTSARSSSAPRTWNR